MKENLNILARYKNGIVLFLKIIVVVLLVWFIYKNVDFSQLEFIYDNVDLVYIIIVFGLGFINIILQFLKWDVAADSIIGELSFSQKFYAFLYGLGGGFLTPMRLGEYLGRSMALKEKSKSAVVTATIFEKIFPNIITNGFGPVALLFFVYIYFELSFWVFLICSSFIFTFFALVYRQLATGKIWDNRIFNKIISIKYLREHKDKILVIRKAKRGDVHKSMIYSLLIKIIFCTQYSLLFLAFTDNITFWDGYWIAIVISFSIASFYIISFNGIGIRESSAVFICNTIGIAGIIGLNVSLIIFIINIIIPSGIGILVFLKKYR